MQIEFLQEYIELAQCLNFTEAANRCNITQPALSKHLVALEKELGTQLVLRDRHKVELTQAGHMLLREALDICERWNRVRKDIGKAATVPILRIGGLLQNSRVLWLVSSVLGADEYGDESITCTYNQTYSKPFVDLLREQELDLVFAYQNSEQQEDDSDEFVSVPVFDDPFVVVVSADHPFAQLDELHMEDLQESTLIHLSGSYYSWGWDQVEAVCLRHGFKPQERMALMQPELDYSLVDIGSDALVLSRSALTGQLFTRMKSRACIPVVDDDAHFSICAIHRKDDPSSSLALFMSRLERYKSEDWQQSD
ncbi:MAG: LysR family transcriptional regulator [Coriobacteriaceae bacterium]|nr:LysR family transcriptional regulator [Coriobacteriaceae bacterium]